MALKMKKSANTGDWENPPNGPHAAVCTRMIDIGTQDGGQFEDKRKIIITWELADLMTDGRPFIVNQRYTASLHPKANLLQHLEAWRGAPIEEEEEFDVAQVVGAPAMLNTLVNERGYCNVVGISRLPKGMDAPKPVGPLLVFDLDDPDWAVFEQLSERLQETIAASPEYRLSQSEFAEGGQPPTQAAQAAAGADDFNDDIPF